MPAITWRSSFGNSRLLLAAALLTAPAGLVAQTRATQLLTVARSQLAANQLDSAEWTLAAALASARYVMDSALLYIWRGVVEYRRGNASLARLNFRQGLMLHPEPGVRGLDSLSPALATVFDSEYRAIRIFSAGDMDQPARWQHGPAFVYPAELRTRRIAGAALLRMVVDTLGRVDARSVDVLETPDSGFIAPLTRMVTAAVFHPARIGGRPVKSLLAYQFNLTPPAPQNPVFLVDRARDQIKAHKPDSALALLNQALDAENGATPAIRVYANLVQGIAWRMQGRDSVAHRSWAGALAQYRALRASGVAFAPSLRTLADSVALTAQRE